MFQALGLRVKACQVWGFQFEEFRKFGKGHATILSDVRFLET